MRNKNPLYGLKDCDENLILRLDALYTSQKRAIDGLDYDHEFGMRQLLQLLRKRKPVMESAHHSS